MVLKRFQPIADAVGTLTANKVASLSLLFVGIAALVGGRFVPSWDGGFWAGIGMLFFAASFWIDAMLPGGSEPTPEQIAALAQIGVTYRPGLEKYLGAAVGGFFLLAGLYLTIW